MSAIRNVIDRLRGWFSGRGKSGGGGSGGPNSSAYHQAYIQSWVARQDQFGGG